MAITAAPAIILLVHFLSTVGTYGATSLFFSMTKLVFDWDAYEGGLYSSFIYLCLAITFFGIFPAMHSMYGFVVEKKGTPENPYSPSWQQTASSSNPDAGLTGIDAVKMDMFFVVAGLCFLIISLLIVPLFPSVPVLYLGKIILICTMKT
ncbi:hypothetical protein BGX33_009870 [Mortierella sp. NVP41]|nr:hypothetical protein BGX33_009870 [Mortierella sp. NVP41]